MSRKVSLVAVLMCGAIVSLPVLAQQESANYRSEASVQALGSFVKSTNDKGIDQSATNSAGVLASYRFFFDKNNGVEINYSYSRNTQNYLLSGSSLGTGTHTHEATAAYVFRFPMKRFSPFVMAGGGALVFDPRDTVRSVNLVMGADSTAPFGATWQARPAFLYGAGADVNFTSRFFLRAGYRGLVYSGPNFDTALLGGIDTVTHRAQPFGGLGFRF